MEWKKQVPNKAGYWLRVNAGHRVQLHLIAPMALFTGREDKQLSIYWGWSGHEEPKRLEDIKDKLKCFYWCGSIPEPPKEIL